MSKKKKVAVSGGFDPIHIGHVRMIREASKFGDVVVILNSDRFLVDKKGFAFMPFKERKEILESIEGVVQVVECIDGDHTVCETLAQLRPHIFANGGDRKNKDDIPEYEVCVKHGIEMVFNVGEGGKVQSSSELAKKMRKE
ncbi:glycerol-3-phosphate cytidylyltransferase [candidate division WS5 bacterium]|uniref:Glycerol-3-phosphate cytidylyltransferase n=1 Tax=candidate division WS5 bacterium TaxID=2093353 RepID=A0A419DG79_9BACT|nr:MAG: glycerol-3-phosphate cytidylyltransferase [candidate division WS5 bacterium]